MSLKPCLFFAHINNAVGDEAAFEERDELVLIISI